MGGGAPDYTPPEIEDDLEDDKKKAKKVRSALLETEGGIAGQEVGLGDVGKRDTLFGN